MSERIRYDIVMVVRNKDGVEEWEERCRDVGEMDAQDPTKWAEDCVARFNADLYPGEKERVLVRAFSAEVQMEDQECQVCGGSGALCSGCLLPRTGCDCGESEDPSNLQECRHCDGTGVIESER